MDTPRNKLMHAFDDLSIRCQRIECALPRQMTEAVTELERSRKEFRTLFYAFMLSVPDADEETLLDTIALRHPSEGEAE